MSKAVKRPIYDSIHSIYQKSPVCLTIVHSSSVVQRPAAQATDLRCYIADLARELRDLASQANEDMLVFLLDCVVKEARPSNENGHRATPA